MDPRVNLEAIGIPGFDSTGEGTSTVRIIRTLGGVADDRSLLVGIFLARIQEVTLVMHTDCGECLAYTNIDVIADNLLFHMTSFCMVWFTIWRRGRFASW
ncbi:hypothetical protein C2W62_10060 [Candidatus Entotheonella serta]|nr:hypothetical protein C2W62_10060 [Candidatus Entotheonella serta]